MVRILLRVGRCPKVAGDPSRLRSEVKILWAYRDQWATITHVNSWSMYFVLVRWSILEFGMMLHADQRGFNGSLVDVCRCRIGNSDFWKLNQGGFRCLRRLMTDGAIYTSTAHCFCMLFVTLFYLNLLRHCQRLTHYCNVTTRIGWNWYVFTVKLLNVYWISFMSRMFLLISSTARFEFLHLCRWRCVLHLWTWKEFLGKCRNQQFHINLALRVVSLWLNLCILHIITYLYIIYIIYISTLHNSQVVVSWPKQWSQTCWCSICSCLSFGFFFFATCTHLNWLIQNISFSRCCRFRGRVSNLLGSILGSEARHPSFPPTHPVSYASRRCGLDGSIDHRHPVMVVLWVCHVNHLLLPKVMY